jgi:hypothetical protein
MAIEKIKILETVLELSFQLQNGRRIFIFFNRHGCQTFILAEIHCYLGARIFYA